MAEPEAAWSRNGCRWMGCSRGLERWRSLADFATVMATEPRLVWMMGDSVLVGVKQRKWRRKRRRAF